MGWLLLEITVRELYVSSTSNDLIELPVEEGRKGGGLPEARDTKTRKVNYLGYISEVLAASSAQAYD